MRRTRLGVALGFIAAIVFAGSTEAFTGASNGSFETGAYADNGSGFEQLDVPDTSIDGWSVDSGSVDWVGTYWTAPDGAMSVDFSGADAGSLSQTFDTTIGNTYTVAFLLSGNPAGPPSLKTLEVSATGGHGLYSHDTTGAISRRWCGPRRPTRSSRRARARRSRSEHHCGPVRSCPRQRRRERDRPDPGRVQERWLAVDDRQRRQRLQEPG